MSVETISIPQADVLWDVALVPEAVLRGRDTHDAIAEYIGAKGQRQGLYYTQAARVLGLVGELTPAGRIELTTYGRAFAQYDRVSQRSAMRRLLREHEPTRSVIEALKASPGMDWNDIARILQRLAPLAESTAQRRARTAAAWLVAAGLAMWQDGQLRYRSLPPPGAGFARI
jgi:hypothetical protein